MLRLNFLDWIGRLTSVRPWVCVLVWRRNFRRTDYFFSELLFWRSEELTDWSWTDRRILPIFGSRSDFWWNYTLYYCKFLIRNCFLPRDEPPQILLGALVVGPRIGFTPTPWINRYDARVLDMITETSRTRWIYSQLKQCSLRFLNVFFVSRLKTANHTSTDQLHIPIFKIYN